MSNAASIRRFSLLSLVLLMTTIGALAGWIGAIQQTSKARQETLRLRREVEQYRAELGQLDVADTTRVHAIGLRRDPQDQNRWKWRVYLPTGAAYRLEIETDQRQSVDVHSAGEVIIEAQLATQQDNTWWLNLAIDGTPLSRAALPGYTLGKPLWFPRLVGPNDRSVWERAERPVLIEARYATETDGEAEAGFAIWLEALAK